MINLQKVIGKAEVKRISRLAATIWTEYYVPVFGKEQVDYMLERIQSEETILKELEGGTDYFFINKGGEVVGYLSTERRNDTFFLNKLYILGFYRKQSIGQTALKFVEQLAEESNCSSITLKVFQENHRSIKAFQRLGFKIENLISREIGLGYVLNGYEMRRELPPGNQ